MLSLCGSSGIERCIDCVPYQLIYCWHKGRHICLPHCCSSGIERCTESLGPNFSPTDLITANFPLRDLKRAVFCLTLNISCAGNSAVERVLEAKQHETLYRWHEVGYNADTACVSLSGIKWYECLTEYWHG